MAAGTSVVIVGGGASAVFVAVALEERAAARGIPAPRITVVGRELPIGRGLAYGRAEPHHRLNSPAGKMSLSAVDDAHFLRWAAEHGAPLEGWSFAPRTFYGDYLEDVFRFLEADSDGRVSSRQGEVVDVTTDDDGAHVRLDDGTTLDADVAVLAIGNPPPATWPTGAAVQIDDPWAVGGLDAIEPGAKVLLIGTGLTMVDVATSLARRDDGIRMTATSRHLLVPRAHLPEAAAPGSVVDAGIDSLGALVHAVHERLDEAERTGMPWQAVVDGMRPNFIAHWVALSEADRRRFVEHVARRWDVRRHRMAASVHEEFQALVDDGTVTLRADVDPQGFDAVVFCTGPASVLTEGWNPVSDALVASGRAVSEPLGLGPAADESGAIVDDAGVADGRLLAIGHALRGALWETTAVGEIRILANRVADRALDAAPAPVG